MTPLRKGTRPGETFAHVLLLVAMFLLPALVVWTEGTPKCEAYGVIVRVVDGDTVDVSNIVYYDELIATRLGSSKARIRFADVNAPELSTLEGEVARKALLELVETYGGAVCLDVDNVRTLDPYGRVIAVVYLRINETHYLNLNKWLLVNNYAELRDFADNEFNPTTWELYVVFTVKPPEKTVTPAITPLTAIWEYLSRFGAVLVMILATVVALTIATHSKRRVRRRLRTRR